MLRRLTIKNLALIDTAQIQFSDGLTALTGESGAGKSLIVRALALALGARADRDDVGSYAQAASIEAEFKTILFPALKQSLSELDVEVSRDKTLALTLRREIAASGRTRAFVNDQLVRLDQLAEIGALVCQIQGQSASLILRHETRQLALVDSFAAHENDIEKLSRLFDNWETTRLAIGRLKGNRERVDSERELLSFQLKELDRARLAAGEEDELGAEKKRLDAAERLIADCEQILSALEGDGAPLETLLSAHQVFERIKAVDATFVEHAELFSSALIQLEEVRRSVSEYQSGLHIDDERLYQVNERLSEIYKLKTKYGGGSVTAAIDAHKSMRERLESLSDTSEELARLEKLETSQAADYTELALRIRTARFAAAKKLTALTEKQLVDLSIPQNMFEFRFTWEIDHLGVTVTEQKRELKLKAQRTGLESGSFYFSANPGEEPKPLARVASGGEMARALLALNAALNGRRGKKTSVQPTAVYDEVDSGVGGATATAMGKKLKNLAASSQVIVVTHLRQVASQADHHLLVEKESDGARNHVTVRALSEAEAKRETLKMVDLGAIPVP